MPFRGNLKNNDWLLNSLIVEFEDDNLLAQKNELPETQKTVVEASVTHLKSEMSTRFKWSR